MNKTAKLPRAIEVSRITLDGRTEWEPARRGNVRAYMLPLPDGYIPVQFPDSRKNAGGRKVGGVLVHRSYIRAAVTP